MDKIAIAKIVLAVLGAGASMAANVIGGDKKTKK